jgi:hypothetical protein
MGVRRARVEDAPAVADVHVRSWRAAYEAQTEPKPTGLVQVRARNIAQQMQTG